jgi:hypothetical protein
LNTWLLPVGVGVVHPKTILEEVVVGVQGDLEQALL